MERKYLDGFIIRNTIILDSKLFTTFGNHIPPQPSPPIGNLDRCKNIQRHHCDNNQRKIRIKVYTEVHARLMSAQRTERGDGGGWGSTSTRSTMTGKIWKRICSRKVLIAAPLDNALRTSPVFLVMWKSRDKEWTCSNALVDNSRYEYYVVKREMRRKGTWPTGIHT